MAAAHGRRTRWNGAPEGFLAGFKSSLIGAFKSLAVTLLALVNLHLLGALTGLDAAKVLTVACVLGLVLCNYLTFKSLFPMLLRVQAEKARPAPEIPEVLAPEPVNPPAPEPVPVATESSN